LEGAFPGAELRLIESSGGAFEVEVDGRSVFSKLRLHRHPEPGEIKSLITDAIG